MKNNYMKTIKKPYVIRDIWLPSYILENKDVNDFEKLILGVISMYQKGCFLSNQEFAEIFSVSKRYIIKVIQSLIKKEFIKKTNKNGIRYLRINKEKFDIGKHALSKFTGVRVPVLILSSKRLTSFEKMLLADIISVGVYYFSKSQIKERYNKKSDSTIKKSIRKLINLNLIEDLGVKIGRRNLRAITYAELYQKLYGNILQGKSYVSTSNMNIHFQDADGSDLGINQSGLEQNRPPKRTISPPKVNNIAPHIDNNIDNNIEDPASKFFRSATLREKISRGTPCERIYNQSGESNFYYRLFNSNFCGNSELLSDIKVNSGDTVSTPSDLKTPQKGERLLPQPFTNITANGETHSQPLDNKTQDKQVSPSSPYFSDINTVFAPIDLEKQYKGETLTSQPCSDINTKNGETQYLSPENSNTVSTRCLNNTVNSDTVSFSDLTEIPYDESIGLEKKTKKKSAVDKYEKLLQWSEKRRKALGYKNYRFVNRVKQYGAMKKAKDAGYTPKDLQERWLELEQDPYWLEKGFDWHAVVSTFDERPL